MGAKYVDELTVKEEAENQWRHDAELRKEFREFPCYLAFHRAQARGLVGIVRTNRVVGGSAQRPIHREDRQELKKWAEQTVRQIRAEHGGPLTRVKPHKVQMLEGPRIFSDAALLQTIASEQDAKQYWDISEALREEFPTPGTLWAYVKMKREGRIKILSHQGGPEDACSTGAKSHTVRTLDGPRQFGDVDLLDEDENGKLRHTLFTLVDAFLTPARRMGRIKTLR